MKEIHDRYRGPVPGTTGQVRLRVRLRIRNTFTGMLMDTFMAGLRAMVRGTSRSRSRSRMLGARVQVNTPVGATHVPMVSVPPSQLVSVCR